MVELPCELYDDRCWDGVLLCAQILDNLLLDLVIRSTSTDIRLYINYE